ncbi:TAT-variant-translocated molybdopterin oxidoreductase [Ruficoccus amylovorans]|uniref:TAT-variant-translocated molybdopterin oxidoreductase n=1 Tax=Ruficoccus amylovorans TaxID=1804625 RepID=A0A842HFK4_9BACT|nr:TAT-variant-translocated molybdopterin oxidoreductase [Ruficoccus amylovorans]MBC2595049.1 TAT-variant-translocated molybdopterin oxidoreductase [Ruficoccus amylovorans]
MKRKVQHPEPTARELAGPRYWRSPDELADTPEFRVLLEREFPEGASETTEADRRTFLKLMGASAAFAGLGLTGCRQPTQHILPYSKSPERMVPGVPIFYASSQPEAHGNIPLVVETHDARPTKIEGNPSYLPYGGGTTGYAQASVLDLYDPDRLQKSQAKDGRQLNKASVVTSLSEVNKAYIKNKGKGLVFLAEPSTSPSRAKLVAQIREAMPEAVWAEYEAVDTENPARALKDISGKNLRPVYDLSKAKRVLALDSDFLGSEPGHLGNSRGFAKGRKVKTKDEAEKMSRLYAVESNFTVTGGQADHRLRAATSQMPAITALILAEVLTQTDGANDIASSLREQAAGVEVDPAWISECVKDLVAASAGHQSLVVAGSHLPVGVHAMVAAINELLKASGHTVNYVELPAQEDVADIKQVADLLNAGEVKTLVILGGNPAYDAPADLDWPTLQQKAGKVVRYGYYADETSELADLTVAAAHYLESWGDGRTLDGVYVPVQPMILPLFDGFSELEILEIVATGQSTGDQGYGRVRKAFSELSGKTDDVSFNAWLTEGVLKDSAFKTAKLPASEKLWVAVGTAASGGKLKAPVLSAESLEVRIVPSSHFYDGRYNNNGWLAEAPDPMTKLTWDNTISISPKLAKHLGVTPKPITMDKIGQLHMDANQFKRGQEQAPVATLSVGGKKITGPIHIQPGLADYTVVIALGFGRRKTGRVGTRLPDYPGFGPGIGFDAYPLTTLASRALALGGIIGVTGEIYPLANTQQHWSMEGRAILREGTADEFAHDPKFVSRMGAEAHSPPVLGNARKDPLAEVVREIPRGGSMYKTPEFKAEQQWGMSIDLNSCTGCNACVIACQSENNIPIVGKDQVLRGRELHWLRLDRYYSVEPDYPTTEIPEDPQVSFMGVACQHCELAPCESVCPVNATVHDEQGLNVMAYNRCVGTRYCANNCPYKVRRFNFFDYNKRERGELYKGPLGTDRNKTEASQLTRMQKNPNVTVRMRGVMEKCTYCVQRIEQAKIDQKVKAGASPNVKVPDGTIKVACQQVCPTEAIVFGDVADPNSEVSKIKTENDRNYSVLGYLNVRPRTTYLARLRNPNPAMPDAYKQPLSRADYEARYGHGGGHHDEGHGSAHGDSHDTLPTGHDTAGVAAPQGASGGHGAAEPPAHH